MKIRINRIYKEDHDDLLYVLLSGEGLDGTECEVPEAFVKRWKRVIRMYEKVQEEMRKAVEATSLSIKEKGDK